MRHVVMFSGGIGSWAAARRTVEQIDLFDLGGCGCFTDDFSMTCDTEETR